MAVQKINSYLAVPGGPADCRDLLVQARETARLQAIFKETLPPHLADSFGLGILRDGSLTLYTSNASIAAKLKQILPTLLKKLQKRGCQITVIRVAVQAYTHFPVMDKTGVKKPEISQTGLDSLNQLAIALPDSALKMAVLSLAKGRNSKKTVFPNPDGEPEE